MAIADLGNVLKIFKGSQISEKEQKSLFHEVLLMVLARASSSDANIHPVEIATIRELIDRETGEKVSDLDVRKAARTELYETTPLAKYLSSVSRSLHDKERVRVIHLLAEVISSDTEISVLEVDFFNRVAAALYVTPAEVAGLIAN